EDSSYFVDIDPDLFKYILYYLCYRVLPIFYNKVKGHNYRIYLTLLKEVKYFSIM
ncbi:hypothetical protein P154DRAFT_449174, partial [Amniculicola lignicola CBS 123094]